LHNLGCVTPCGQFSRRGFLISEARAPQQVLSLAWLQIALKKDYPHEKARLDKLTVFPDSPLQHPGQGGEYMYWGASPVAGQDIQPVATDFASLQYGLGHRLYIHRYSLNERFFRKK
jgi:hypothetical protein